LALLILALVIVPVTTAIVVDSQRYPRRFAVVEDGRLYRGGFPTGKHIEHLADDLAIRSIVKLTDGTNSPRDLEEHRSAMRLNVQLHAFPMPGDGRAPYPTLSAAADAIADVENQPVFWHCAAGKQRSNAALAAYRLKHLGWSLEQVLEELEQYDLDRDAERELVDHLAGFDAWLRESRTAPLPATTPAQ